MNVVYKTVLLTIFSALLATIILFALMVAAFPIVILLLVDLIALKIVYDSLLSFDSSTFLTLAYFTFVVGVNYYIVTRSFIPLWEGVKDKLGELY